MRTSHRNLLILAMAIISCGALLAGCSESRGRRDSKNLSAAVREAQRSQQRAIVLLGNPAYRDTKSGQVSPLTSPLATSNDPQATSRAVEQIEMLPDQVHPEVPKLLADARKGLESAIAANPAASGDEMAQARMMLASLKKVQGDAQSRTFGFQAVKVRAALDQLSSQQAAAGVQYALVTSLSVTAGEAPELQKAYDDTAANLKDVETQLAAKTGELKTASGQADALKEKCAAQSSEVIALHQELQAADPRGSQDKVRQFGQKYEELNANQAALQQLEAQIEQLKSELAQLNVKLAGFGAKSPSGDRQLLAQLKSLAQQRTDAVAATGKLAADAQEKVKAAYTATGAAAKELQTAIDEANKTAGEAVASYTSALADVSEALKVRRTPAIRAAEGMLGMAKAAIILDQRRMQQDVQSTMTVANNAWTQMGQAKLAAPTLQDDNELKTAAVKSLDSASLSFEQARDLNAASPNTQWLYDGAEGAAYLAKYDLTGDAKDKEEAATHLRSASMDKENSPNLASIMSLLQAVK